MNRDIINLTEYEMEELICGEAPIGFKWKDKTVEYYDREKNTITYQIVIQRLFDKKFFACRYSCWGSQEKEWEDEEFTEVFPKETVIITYE